MEKKKLILIGGGHRGKGYTGIRKDLGKFELIAEADDPVITYNDLIIDNNIRPS